MCPGKKVFVSVKTDGIKQHKQRRLLLCNLNELHANFKQKFGQKISLSKFCELCPKWCITVRSSSGFHPVYVCVQHQNAKLIADCIPGLTNHKILLEQLVRRFDNRQCMLQFCEHCPCPENLR